MIATIAPGAATALAVASTAAFLLAAERPRARRLVRGRHRAAWCAGIAVALVAVTPPLDALAADLASAHMIQHLLLLLPAPILLVVARPALLLALAASPRWRTNLQRWRRPRAAAGLLPVAWAVHLAVVAGWHAPPAYESALRAPLLHLIEHASMLAAAAALWALLLARGAPGRRRAAAAACAAAATGVIGGALGVLLVTAPAPWFPTYVAAAARRGGDALLDQQLAGALMWVGGGLAYAAAACALLVRCLHGTEAHAHRRARRAAGGWMAVLVLAALVAACTDRSRGPGSAADEQVARGRELVASAGCGTCHHVPGIAGAQGQVGPSLAGFANRRSVAGILPNTPAAVARWVRDPQDVLPGNLMPDVGLDEEQADAVAAYLATLD